MIVLCRVMQVSRSAYYDWCKRPAKVITAKELHLNRRIMAKLGLNVTQCVAYKVTAKRNDQHAVALNLLKQNFNPLGPNEVWAGDITYLKTGEGWMYLAVVMDLFSRRIVGWHIDKRMTTDLIVKAMMKAYNLRQPQKGLVFHSDRGSQYTSRRFGKLLSAYVFVQVWEMLALAGITLWLNVFLVA